MTAAAHHGLAACFDGFELNHNQIFDYHIHPVAAMKLDSLVDDWQRTSRLTRSFC
jgi:hypothetical protein